MMLMKKEREEGERSRHRHGLPTLMLLRKRLSRSQSVACADVQAGGFKALAGSAPAKNLPNGQTLWSVSQDGSNETRKNRVHVETLALRENAVTQEYRLNASVSRVCPCQSHSEYRLNLIAASFSGQRVPVLRVTGLFVQCLVVDLELFMGKWRS